MAVTINTAKVKKNILRKVVDARPFYEVIRRYSQKDEVAKFFKFYNDSVELEDRYKPLSENDYNRFVSSRSSKREPSLTRQISLVTLEVVHEYNELLKYAFILQPGIPSEKLIMPFLPTTLSYKVGKQVLSLAEGMPNEQVFPYTKISMEMKNGKKLELDGSELRKALQYVPSQGLPALLTELRQFQEDLHRPPPLPRDIIVTNGGQHGIYQCVELLVEPGDPVLTTQYAYTGLHSALKPYNPEVLGIPEDDDGMLPEMLDNLLGDRLKRGLKMPKILYLIPTGSNPTGTVLPEDRRRQIYELACKYDFLIVEDDPYMFLNYSDVQVPSFLSLDRCGRVLRLDSVSKVVSAGLRGGWVTAPAPLLRRLELHSQAELLHSCTLAQAMILHLVSDRSYLHQHLTSARALYRQRRDALFHSLGPVRDLAYCPQPGAGLFLWMKVHGVRDVYNMVFQTAFQRGLMLIPGQAFTYDTSAPSQYLRLTFSKIRFEDMDAAIRHLAEIIKHEQTSAKENRAKVQA